MKIISLGKWMDLFDFSFLDIDGEDEADEARIEREADVVGGDTKDGNF